ncbi:MAG: hypothetical protein ACJ0PV_03915 [Flavobacteriaceae bacterium]
MKSIILTTLFLIPLVGFASFPIQTTSPSDTIIESKKETMEEYNIRIEKQLYSKSEEINVFANKNFLRIFSGVLVALGLILGKASLDVSDFSDALGYGIISFFLVGLGGILFLIDLIRRAILKRKS